jgi:radical SAM superfamily enzyme YgiQ (UPF0313 family)
MNILLVNPKTPDTYWSFKHALRFIAKKAANPPLGLITVAAMLPADWQKKLVDLNVAVLHDRDLHWADYVFISAMSVQQDSVREIIERCKRNHKKMVAGGPLFTGEPENFTDIDYLVLNEAEITLPQFLSDLGRNRAKKIYRTEKHASLDSSPVPDYSLIDHSKYAQLSIQYSRGCPFNCEFCEITALLGRKVRTKSTEQVLLELDNIYNTGNRGNIFFVDDNFIGNKKKLKNELLPAIISWNMSKGYPFDFTTEASINLSDDPELMDLMTRAGFVKVFVGIESPDEGSLEECDKKLNKHRDLIHCVNKIQSTGMEVMAGFIVGFDNDSPGIFQRQIDFIQQSGIITAMVGLLIAPNNTRLYKRLSDEGRIIKYSSGDNTGYSINFIPKMDKEVLLTGYQNIVRNIYSSKAYYERVILFLKNFQPRIKTRTAITFGKILALLRSIIILGILKKNQLYYWRLFFWSLIYRPKLFPLAITYSIYGYHFKKVFRNLS